MKLNYDFIINFLKNYSKELQKHRVCIRNFFGNTLFDILFRKTDIRYGL